MPKLEFLANMNISPLTVERLRTYGWNIARVSYLPLLEDPRPDLITTRIIDVVSIMEKELEEGVVVTVDETSVRYRNLPIRLE